MGFIPFIPRKQLGKLLYSNLLYSKLLYSITGRGLAVDGIAPARCRGPSVEGGAATWVFE